MPEIFIRTDANAAIGMGHVMRCFALTQMLVGHFKVTFFCRSIPESAAQLIQQNNIDVFKIESEQEFINRLSPDVLAVLDGYNFDTTYQHVIKQKGAILICIDDLHQQKFIADLIINAAPGIEADAYQQQLYTQVALGPSYALLRPPFLHATAWVRIKEKPTSVLICFGGSDPDNLTERTLRVVQNFPEFKTIRIVIGHAYAKHDALKQRASTDSRIVIYKEVDAQTLASLFTQVQLAVVPASGVLTEALATGVGIVSGFYIRNQQFVYEAYKALHAFADAGNFETDKIEHAIKTVLHKTPETPRLIDGKSGERLLKRFMQLSQLNNLTIRVAEEADLKQTYTWATNPAIRAFSFQQKEIQWAEHQQWFQTKLNDANCVYLMASIYQQIIGSIRFDYNDSNTEALISYLVDPQFHAKGYGLIMLAKSFVRLQQFLNARGITSFDVVGYVMANNYPSIKTFVNLGFQRVDEDGKLKFVKRVHGTIN